MKMRHLLLAALSLLMGWGTFGVAQAAPRAAVSKAPVVSFEAGDNPGNFFTCINTGNSKSGFGCVPQLGQIGTVGEKSLAVIAPGETVGFPTYSGEASTVHTALSLIYPTGAKNMPFKTAIDVRDPAKRGVATVTLNDPGLYVFICDIHVYMFAAVIVDDPNTKVDSPNNILQQLGLGPIGLDLGKKISLVNGVTVPTYSDLALRLLRTFFIATKPGNWKDYTKDSWAPVYPAVPVIVYDENGKRLDVPNVAPALAAYDPTLPFNPSAQLSDPGTAPVGEIWVDTQFELTAGKSKPGTATAVTVDAHNKWVLTKKIALPTHNMNHPHNMWTDRNQTVIYQTQWLDERLTVFNRTTGEWMYDLPTGPAPSHVMTRVNNDQVHVAQNGGNNVREFDAFNPAYATNPLPKLRDIPMGPGGEDVFTATHPHGHWMSHNGMKMVTPNENLNTSTVYDFTGDGGIAATIPTGHVPIATGMMPDSSKYYVANFLDNTITVINPVTGAKVHNDIDLLKIGMNYFPLDVAGQGNISGPVGALPIQTPVSPDGTNMVTANTLTGTITVVDTRKGSPTEDQVVAMLPCDPGCHGVQYGAKDGGGYYAYVASKFSNALIVVDPAPGGNPANATIAGRVLLGTVGATTTDFSIPDRVKVIGQPGMGGQGVLPIPVVYNGWVQELPAEWCSKLSPQQRNPIGSDPSINCP
ncbi:MAG: copper oxidase [Nitrospira sp.]